MPMPPPKPSTEAHSDPRRRGEMTQLTRALRARGPLAPDELGQAVGAAFWDRGRFDEALALTLANGLVVRDRQGRLRVP